MTPQIYASLEFDHERVVRFTNPEHGEPALDGFLDYLAGDDEPRYAAEARDLEAFLWQRQSHVLGRADRR
ncbi:MAG: hypothetical protein AB1Z98_27640 [Nannocystaceae bacterium]